MSKLERYLDEVLIFMAADELKKMLELLKLIRI